MKLKDIEYFLPLMEKLQVSKVSRGKTEKQGFFQTYKEEKGNVLRMKKRGVKNTTMTWHEKRKSFIKRHLGAVKKNQEKFYISGVPTRRTLSFYAWAYDPSPKDTKKYIKNVIQK